MNDILDTVAQELITADPENLQDLGTLISLFESVRSAAIDQGISRIAEAASSAIDLLKHMMFDEGDRSPALAVLSDTISAMQLLSRPGTDHQAIEFPRALGLTTAASLPPENKDTFQLPAYLDRSIFDDFLSGQDSVLESIESHLLTLEKAFSQESVLSVRRIFHTLKGEAGVFQLNDIVRCCHLAEDVIDRHSDASLPIDRLLAVKDWLKEIFDALKSNAMLPSLDAELVSMLEQQCEEGTHPVVNRSNAHDAKSVFKLPEHFDERIFAEFLADQDSAMEDMDLCLLRLEKGSDPDALAILKRILHTLKGESAVMNLVRVADICHRSEDLIEVSDAALPVDRLFAVKDWLKSVFDALKNKQPMPDFNDSVLADVLCAAAHADVEVTQTREAEREKSIPDPGNNEAGSASSLAISADLDLLSDFVSEVKEHIDTIDSRLLSLENTPDDPDLLNAVFRVFHTIKGAAGFLALDEISRLAHTTENLLDLARKHEVILSGIKVDVIFEAVDEMKKLVGTIESSISRGELTYPKNPSLDSLLEKIQRIISEVRGGDTHNPAMNIQSAVPKPASSTARSDTTADAGTPGTQTIVADALPEAARASACDEGTTKAQTITIKESIKVDSENLDKLIDAIGELVITEAMIRQNAQLRKSSSASLLRNMQQMNKITRELQQLGMSLRMIPVRATFQKMARVVRDLAKKSGKDIEFIPRGEDTMLDKSVVDRIGDPLIHLVRNSVDHGIESNSADRLQGGKSKTAHVTLTAFHKGGNIHIEIHDDGRGLNKEAIVEKAREKGLIKENQPLTDREIYDLILLPGFSTAKKVTDVSGRGVGMDVVKRAIEDLRGNIEIDSEAGKGTTFSLRLPLTLAIIDGMLIGVGTQKYIIPTLSIVESIRPKANDIVTITNRGEMISIRDSLIPLFRLASLFDIRGAKQDPCEAIVIVVEDSGKKTGLMVDELLGQQSTVIKSLGASLKGLPGVSGGSIMSDGRVGIILDIAGIVKLATLKNGAGVHNVQTSSA